MEDSLKAILIFPKISDEYQEEYNNLKNATKIDKTTEDLLYRFSDIFKVEKNRVSAPLKENDLKRLPNLFEASGGTLDTSEYNKFLDILFDLAKTRSLNKQILTYLTSYLENINLKALNNNINNNHLMISTLYILFYYYYGENGRNLDDNFKLSNDQHRVQIKAIGVYLGETPNSPSSKIAEEQILAELRCPCRVLQKLLHSNSGSAADLVRFKARDLCKRLYIDLDLAFLIRLGLGDMLEKSSEKKTANLMLVVGYTGAGKSTTINYLAGVEYMPCFRPKFHLKQKDPNQVAPAQVGHGHNSETLFPNTVKIDNISFCDLPGFNDTGPEPYKSFASLGLPLAVHTAKDRAIRAVLVVIEYDAIKMGRLEQLSVVMKTIHSILGTCNHGNQVPILYLITRPQLPPSIKIVEDIDEYNSLCNVNETAKTLMEAIRNLIGRERNLLVKPDSALRQNLMSKLQKLHDCQVILTNLEQFKPQQSNYWSNIANRLYRNNIIDKGNLAREKENFIKELRGDIEEDSIEMMSQFIEDVLSELCSQDSNANYVITNMVDKKRKQFESEIEKTSKEITKEVEAESRFNEKSNLIEFIEKIKEEDIMIMRGFVLHDDNNQTWDDHKQRLFDRLTHICTNDQNNVSLKINGEDAQFAGVKQWLIAKLDYFVSNMEQLDERKSEIEKLREQITIIKKQIELDRKLLISTLTRSMQEKDNAELIERIEASLANLKEMKETYEKKYRDENENVLNSCLVKIDEIKRREPVEYASKLYSNRPGVLSKMLRVRSEHAYTFPRICHEEISNQQQQQASSMFEYFLNRATSMHHVEHVLPICYVEMSCVTSRESNNKLVFRTPFRADSQMLCEKELEENSIVVRDAPYAESIAFKGVRIINSDGSQTSNTNGKFTEPSLKTNLSDGQFKVGYTSGPGKESLAGIRCFVKAEHLPYFKNKIKEYKDKIEACKKNEDIFTRMINQLNHEIASKEELLQNTAKGLYDKKKGDVILDILCKLGYNLEEFLNVMALFGPNEPVRIDLMWIGEMDNLKKIKTLLIRYEEIKNHINTNISFVSKTTFANLIYGKTDDDEIKESMQDDAKHFHLAVDFQFEEIDFYQIHRLCLLSKSTGLTLTILNMIVRTLKTTLPKENSLFKEVEAKRNLIRELKERFEKILSQIESEKWMFDIVELIAEMLNYRYLFNYKYFQACFISNRADELNHDESSNSEENRSSQNITIDEDDDDDKDELDEEDVEKEEESESVSSQKDQQDKEKDDSSQMEPKVESEFLPESDSTPKPNDEIESPTNQAENEPPDDVQTTPLAVESTAPTLKHLKKAKAPKKKPPTSSNNKKEPTSTVDVTTRNDVKALYQQPGRRKSDYQRKIFLKIAIDAVTAWKITRENELEDNNNELEDVVKPNIEQQRDELNETHKLSIKPPSIKSHHLNIRIPSSDLTKPESNVFKILSIDGGGIRALLPALILVELEKSSGKQLKYMFDMICGTSTGALLSALILLAPEIDLVQFFTENIRDIYGDKTGENDLCSSDKLESILKGVFGERKFISVGNEPNLVFPTSTDSSQHPEAHIFDSCSAATKLNYADITIVDVLMATMASPGFFKPHTIGDSKFLDGGITANNPTRIGYNRYQDLVKNKLTPKTSVFVFSIGTGKSDSESSEALFWPGIKDNSKFTERQMKAALPSEDNYVRLQIDLDKSGVYGYGDVNGLEELRKAGDEFVESLERDLKRINNILNEITTSQKTPKILKK